MEKENFDVDYILDKMASRLEVENTLTLGCYLLSLDQRAASNLIANARYSVSSWSGLTLFASCRNRSNSCPGIISILSFNKFTNSLKSSSESEDFAMISSLCSSNSINKNSGAISWSLSENIRSHVLLLAIIAKNRTLASTTSNILRSHFNPGYSSLYRSCNPLFIFLPSSRASFSVNALLDAMDFNLANFEACSRIASLATFDQSINDVLSISCFKSSGITTFISAIPIACNYIDHVCINNLSSGAINIAYQVNLVGMGGAAC
ncbi:MAG: hypothetical protein SCAL_000174 [Candidatus Syntrophoarchaeum caldarius]|uniref:Uncharacterized protein n=1 Tax=Candidatus Syntropharchaeum caldarium TaxID=1838285 RepID=A0A1F2PB91_9EURY|nr:MAG: hypothetical protein SCAL_000174 [Candidatus Syntrophoarchaeum caldarius]